MTEPSFKKDEDKRMPEKHMSTKQFFVILFHKVTLRQPERQKCPLLTKDLADCMCVHAFNTTNMEGMEEKKCDLFRVNMSLLNPKPRRWKSTVLNYSKRWLWLNSIMPGYVQ